MAVVYSNNASTALTSGITNSATSITVGSVADFPALTGSDYYYATLANVTNTKIEIVKVTAAAGTTLTVVRGQDNTTAVSFDASDNLQLRVTAATLESATSTDVAITGGSIAGSVIDSNTIGADALNVSGNGTAGQYLGSDADGTFTWTSISSDPSMGGDLSGTASNAQIVANAVTDTELNSAKLNGIEAGATADQTGAEIKTAYEGESDTNAFTDADHSKLDGIEASADVTDTANVTAAGALMDSEITNLADVKAFDTTDYATSTQGTTADNALPKAGGTMTGDVSLGDNVKANFGAGDDLHIYHDGANSYIQDVGTGSLYIKADNDIFLSRNGNTEVYLKCRIDGAVTLYHNDNEKLATTSTGINVTGTVNATTVDLGNWTVTESAGVLKFATGGVNKAKLDASGNFTVVGDLTAFGTI